MRTANEIKFALDQFIPRDYQKPVSQAFLLGGFKKIMIIWPRRCLHGDTHIIMGDGSFKLLKDIQIGDCILSWDGSNFVPDRVKNAWKTEIKDTLKLQSFGFLPIISSRDHMFAYSHSGCIPVSWKKAGELTRSCFVQNYAGLPLGKIHNPDLAEFYGYLLADGYVCGYQQPKFTNVNSDILKRVEELAVKLFGVKVIWREKGNSYDLGLSNGTKGGVIQAPIKDLFKEEGLNIPKSQRHLPKILWDLDEESLLRFFAAIISCDGNIYLHNVGFESLNKNRLHKISHANELTISCGLSYNYAWGIYWLLRKMGIVPHVPYKDRGRNWAIKIARSSFIKKLLSYGPIYGKIDVQQKALDRVNSFRKIPKITFGCYRNSVKISNSDSDYLYDIETEKHHNFVANGYLVHNSGKDLLAFNLMLRKAIERVGIYYAIYPTYSQAKKILWSGMTNDGKKFLDFIPAEIIANTNSTEMRITLINGSQIQLVGSADKDKLMGTNPVGVLFSEFALSDPQCYYYIKPILAANNGWQIICSTPRGHNTLYQLFQIAQNNPDWFCSKLTLDDTRHVSLELIEREIQQGEISRDLVEQEYYTSFNLGICGSFYASAVDRMRVNEQINQVPFEPHLQVSTSWDIGLDTTAIIFFQPVGPTIRIIDYYENSNLSFDHYVNVIKSKPYNFAKHIGPHDIANREYTTGISRIDIARNLGIRFSIAPNLSVPDGIEHVRALLSRTWIDQNKCSQLIKAIENYRQEYDEKTQTYKGKPVHDQWSHAADALRMMACYLAKSGLGGLTAQELDKRYQEAILRGTNNVPRPFREEPW